MRALPLAALLSLGTPPQGRAQAPAAEPRLPDCASPLMRSIFEAVLPVVRRGSVDSRLVATGDNDAAPKPFLGAAAVFAGAAELIAGAEREVDFQTYVWEDGSQAAEAILGGIAKLQERRRTQGPASSPATAGAAAVPPDSEASIRDAIAALRERQKAPAPGPGRDPVMVRLFMDANDFGIDSEPIGKQVPILQARLDALGLDPALVRVEVAAYDHALLGVLHSKTLIVDGRRAIVMGANAQKKFDAPDSWFDAGYRFDGEMAGALREDFADAWSRGTRWTCGTRVVPGGIDPRCMSRNQPLPPLTAAASPAHACLPMLVVTTKSHQTPLLNRTDNPADQALLGGFGAASRIIRAQTPALNDDAARAALLDAVIRRGTEVDLVLSKGFDNASEDKLGQGGDNEKNVSRLYRALEQAGVRDPCSRLKVRWYSYDGRKPVVGNGPHASHAKYASFDGAVVIVGSSNLDTQSWNCSREIDVVVDDAATVASWDKQVFLPNFARAVPVDECAADGAR